jgi:hypothetical protein
MQSHEQQLGQTLAAFQGKFDPAATLGISKKQLKAWSKALELAGRDLAASTEGVVAIGIRPGGPRIPPSQPGKTEKRPPAKPQKKEAPAKKPGRPLE